MTHPAPLFDVPVAPVIPVIGESQGFPVHRIFCVGRNYAAHAAEMGNAVDRTAPFYFNKPPTGLLLNGSTMPYPPGTSDCHHEIELVIAIGAPAFRIAEDAAESIVYGYAVGLDMTRRDLQQVAKDKGRPWDMGKGFEGSAIIGAITKAADFTPDTQRIALAVNGETKQVGHFTDLIWSVAEMISHLSRYYHLTPGDLIYTGTPSGVGPVAAGDVLVGEIEGLETLEIKIGPAE
ncbi:fumarylacetoacetate hydrolase family protein [Rhizobium sp. 18065]|uniref:fumarylacetoacetate hydrolase family protein n=1 Tax=Rhizobium sp. 18065 TaxID=2681411 RepID=UPI00135AE3F5|nr:fumarylacetoacetate hydrolase family protein [Rhizobium sp. 18065]